MSSLKIKIQTAQLTSQRIQKQLQSEIADFLSLIVSREKSVRTSAYFPLLLSMYLRPTMCGKRHSQALFLEWDYCENGFADITLLPTPNRHHCDLGITLS